MGVFTVGEVVVIKFPFSNLSYTKLRPALVLAKSDYDNIVVVQITSKLPEGCSGILLTNNDFVKTTPLQKSSYIRHNKIFTADPKLVVKSLGKISVKKRKEILSEITKTFSEL